MGRVNQRYTRQFRDEAMDLVRVKGYDVARAARELGVPVTTLNMWLRKAGWVRPPGYGEGDESGALKAPSEDPARLRARVTELERQVKRLEMEKEILKKATAFFASQNT
jgi:transposase